MIKVKNHFKLNNKTEHLKMRCSYSNLVRRKFIALKAHVRK